MTRYLFTTCVCLLSVSAVSAQQHALEEMSLERWAKLREVERHQLQIAEKYYREKKWNVAISEQLCNLTNQKVQGKAVVDTLLFVSLLYRRIVQSWHTFQCITKESLR